jgi:hypothetical protein
MMGMFGYELSFLQIEVGGALVVEVVDTEAEETGKVKDKEQGEVSQYTAIAGIQMDEGIFDEIEKFCIGLGLTDTFLEQFHHEEGDGIFEDIEKDVLVDDAPFELTDTLQVLEIVVIDHEVEDGSGLEEIGLAGTFAGRGPDAVDEIRLKAEQLGVDGDDKGGLAVFDGAQDDTFCFVEFQVLKLLFICRIIF